MYELTSTGHTTANLRPEVITLFEQKTAEFVAEKAGG